MKAARFFSKAARWGSVDSSVDSYFGKLVDFSDIALVVNGGSDPTSTWEASPVGVNAIHGSQWFIASNPILHYH